LLEVLVSLIVFALVFGILAQILQTGLRQSHSAKNMAAASLLARSQLARIGTELPLEVGETEGEADGMRWRTVIDLAEMATENAELAPYRVQVTVAWDGDRTLQDLTLTTLRIGPVP
jgi:hypothetical protein